MTPKLWMMRDELGNQPINQPWSPPKPLLLLSPQQKSMVYILISPLYQWFIYLFIYLFISFIYLFINLLFMYLFIYLLFIHLYIYTVCVSIYIYIYCMCIYLSISIYIYIYVHLFPHDILMISPPLIPHPHPVPASRLALEQMAPVATLIPAMLAEIASWENWDYGGIMMIIRRNSYWKWPFIVDLPIKNGDFP